MLLPKTFSRDRKVGVKNRWTALFTYRKDVKLIILRGKKISWINWIRNKADWIDPLISREDESLGKKNNVHKFLEGI